MFNTESPPLLRNWFGVAAFTFTRGVMRSQKFYQLKRFWIIWGANSWVRRVFYQSVAIYRDYYSVFVSTCFLARFSGLESDVMAFRYDTGRPKTLYVIVDFATEIEKIEDLLRFEFHFVSLSPWFSGKGTPITKIFASSPLFIAKDDIS